MCGVDVWIIHECLNSSCGGSLRALPLLLSFFLAWRCKHRGAGLIFPVIYSIIPRPGEVNMRGSCIALYAVYLGVMAA